MRPLTLRSRPAPVGVWVLVGGLVAALVHGGDRVPEVPPAPGGRPALFVPGLLKKLRGGEMALTVPPKPGGYVVYPGGPGPLRDSPSLPSRPQDGGHKKRREREDREDVARGNPRWVLPDPGRYIPTTVEQDGGTYQGWKDKESGKVVLGVPMRSKRGGRKAQDEDWEYKTLDVDAFKKAYQDGGLALWAYPSAKLQSMLAEGDIMEDDFRKAMEDQVKYGSTWFQGVNTQAKPKAKVDRNSWFWGAE